MKMSNCPGKSAVVMVIAMCLLSLPIASAVAADINTSSLSQNGWYSDDTRADGFGTQPSGTNLVSPTLTDAPENGAGNPLHDADIVSQIIFGGAPGIIPPATYPGAVHLRIGAGSGAGKSTISHRKDDGVGFGTGAAVLGAGLSATYSWMGDGTSSITASLKLGFKTVEFGATPVSARTGENSWDKLVIYEPGNLNGGVSDGTWRTESPTFTTGTWWLVDRRHGANTIGSPMTLSAMSSSAVVIGPRTVAAVWAVLMDPGTHLTSVQFGIGSGNPGGSVYVNELTTSFYRAGDRTTFGPIPPVHNITQDSYHATIQAAINAATSGDVIEAAAGTYNESPVINKSLTLQGAGCGLSEIVLSGATYLSALEITGAGTSATIRDFTITGYDAVGMGLASTNILVYQPTGDTLIEDCCLKVGKRGPGTNGDDGFGVLTTYFDSSVVIDSVTVTGCSFDPVTDGGRGFYINPGVGVFTFSNNRINALGSGSSFTQAADGLIEGNTISGAGTAGSRLGGVGAWGYPDPSLWGRTTFRRNTISNAFAGVRLLSVEDSLVEENTISNCDYGVVVTDFFQAFDPSTDTIFNNSIEDIEFLSIQNTEATLVDASGNWYGSNMAVDVSAAVSPASVDYTPWLDDGTDTDGGTAGFQGDFSSLWVDDDSPQSGLAGRVQEGVDLVTSSTVNVLPGLYEEQVVIDTDDLNLIGSGSGTNPAVDTIIKSPITLTYSYNTGLNNFPVIGVHDCDDVDIENLRVDGAGRGNSNYRFQGIAYWNADGNVTDCAVTGIRETPLSGTQHGVAIYSNNNTGGPFDVSVTNCDVDDYQKNGFVLNGVGLSANVVGSTVTGSGPLGLGLPAQNGIQVSGGASAIIDGCAISNHQYTPATFASVGVLQFGPGQVDVLNCQITENLPGVYVIDGSANVSGSTITNSGAPGTGDAIDIVNSTAPLARSSRPSRVPAAQPIDGDHILKAEMAMPRSITIVLDDSDFIGGDLAGTAGVYAGSGTSLLSISMTNCNIVDWDYGYYADEYGAGTVATTANYNSFVGNETFGFYASGSSVQNAEYNWWDAPSGPLDLTGSDEADNPPCFDPSTMSNVNGLGDEVSDVYVDYCPWLGGTGTLVLEIASACPDDALPGEPGYQIIVEVSMRDLLQDVTGFQAFIAYDNSTLTYRGDLDETAYTGSPFPLHIQPIETADLVVAGEIYLDGSVNFGGSGTSANALLATLVFDVDMTCMTSDVSFVTGGLPSELSFEGNALITGTVDTGVFTLDDEEPGLFDPGNITFECDGAGNTDDIADWIASVTANDACDGALVVTNDYSGLSDDCGETGSATVTFSSTDACGNEATLIRTVTVSDTTNPTFTFNPGDATFECDGLGNAGDIAAWLASFAADDDCSSVTLADNYTGLSNDCGATGSATVTFTAEDECGLTSQVVQTITVEDTTPPSFSVDPGNAVFECDGSGNTADIAAWLASAAADDDCGPAVVTDDYVGLTDDCGATGTATVTFTATDECGLTAELVRTVTVQDTTAPTFTGDPGDATFECDGAGNTAEIAAWLAGFTADDVCGSASVADDYTGLSDDCGATGTATVTFTATDECGLTAQVVRTVTVEDTTLPVVVCPDDITVNADAGLCTASIDPGMATASDDCGSVIITGTRDDSFALDDPYPAGVTTITWSATDECSLVSITCDQTITVNALNDVTATVVLAGVVHQGALVAQTPLSFTRNIRFIAKNGSTCAAPVCVPVTFAGGAGDTATATVTFSVDCGAWTDLCAKDPQHTLIAQTTLTDTGDEYAADTDLLLAGGDTDNDSDVDINDVTYLLFRFGTVSVLGPGPCPYNGVRDADFSFNGLVGLEDYSFLISNWLTFSTCPCGVFAPTDKFGVPFANVQSVAHSANQMTGPGVVRGAGTFRTRLSVSELAPGVAAAADLNTDGQVDFRDIQIFEIRNGLPAELSSLVQQADEEVGDAPAASSPGEHRGR